MLTKNEIISQLEKFNIPSGKPVIVHSSLKAVGKIDGGAETLLSALIECITNRGGLLCIPTHTWIEMSLDLKNPGSSIGALPDTAAKHPLGIRSLHPTHSITVFGEKDRAEKFVEDEAYVDTPVNPEGCYGNIYKEDGYVLLIGVDHTKNTFLHCIEEMMNVPERLTDEKIESTIIHKNGNVEKRKLYWFDESKIPDVSVNFGKFETAFRHHKCITDGFIGNAPSQLCSASAMKSVLELIYKNAQGKELLADDSPLDNKLYTL